MIDKEIKELSISGEGIVEDEQGRKHFIRGAFPGDVVRLDKQWHLQALLRPAVDRLPSSSLPCPHSGLFAGECGGCPWLALPYERQLFFKNERIRLALNAFCDNDEKKLLAIIPSPRQFAFRNRCQLKTDGQHICFQSLNTQTLAPINNCVMLNEKTSALLQEIKNSLPRSDWRPTLPHPYHFFDLDDDMSSIDDIVLDRRRPFRQGNDETNHIIHALLKEWIKEIVDESIEKKSVSVLELYAGSGNLTRLLLSFPSLKIIASDINDEAILKLKTLAPPPQLTVIKLDLNHEISQLSSSPSLLLLDPPRQGFTSRKAFFACSDLAASLQWILYVSCDLKSFQRDCAYFVQKENFQLRKVQAVDQFPHTPHIELVALLQKRKTDF